MNKSKEVASRDMLFKRFSTNMSRDKLDLKQCKNDLVKFVAVPKLRTYK